MKGENEVKKLVIIIGCLLLIGASAATHKYLTRPKSPEILAQLRMLTSETSKQGFSDEYDALAFTQKLDNLYSKLVDALNDEGKHGMALDTIMIQLNEHEGYERYIHKKVPKKRLDYLHDAVWYSKLALTYNLMSDAIRSKEAANNANRASELASVAKE